MSISIMLISSIFSWIFLLATHLTYKFFLENRKRKPMLLIIDKIGQDFSRLKRLRYACTKAYETWYEQIDTEDPDAVKKSIDELFPEYDSVCLLEGINHSAAKRYIQASIKLNKELFIVPLLFDMIYSKINLMRFDDVLGFHVHPYRITAVQSLVKRIVDLFVSSLMLIFAAVPMIIIATLIKTTSPGSILYSQERVTKDKRVFKIYKFRTMISDAEKLTGPVLATKDDPRITKIGGILRKCRLDELPQLFNIFNRDMSLVGPRPERPFFVDQFSHDIENYDYRFVVRAGLTSLSHVYGKYSTDIYDRTRYDLLYISNYSLITDIKVLLQTSRIILTPSAAEGVEIQASSKNTINDKIKKVI